MVKELFLVGAFALGLVVGSFLNVVIYRLPRGEGVALGRSRCPSCGETLRWYDLVPVLSFLLLRGRCRYCSVPISWRYPLVELLSGCLALAVAARFGLGPEGLKYYFLLSCLLAASFIDVEYYIIPNRLVLTAFLIGVPLGIWARDVSLSSALVGALSSGGFLFFLALVSRGGMGGGDIKLAAVSGLFLGWPLAFLGTFLGCLIAGVWGIILLLTRRKGRKDHIPFGPFLSLGFLVALFWGRGIWQWYASLLGF
ncbi:prepilin peptidase [Ammonifex thiophilus]|uniref:Prepilin peptidase n=1 Tax=Ammonifex thiophilus TaxID=444093 RepID=A0A3D8P5K4_9THEO|nr:A24 family peptidase [Ammonifex thiophilus]RDV83216.1 prepilin peptidase [Ammonifex thiophilus]